MNWTVKYKKRAEKDVRKLKSANLGQKVERMLAELRENPFKKPPPFEKLVGDLRGCFSRKINIQHRLVYQLIEEDQTIIVHSMFLHYE